MAEYVRPTTEELAALVQRAVSQAIAEAQVEIYKLNQESAKVIAKPAEE